MILRALLVCPLVLLAACRDSGAPTGEQNADLNEAERLLEETPNSLEEIDENALLESNAVKSPAANDQM